MTIPVAFRSKYNRAGLASALLLLAFVLGGTRDLPGQEAEASATTPPRIVPVDESPGHPAFHRFWMKFQNAVEARDSKFLLSIISDDIKLDFGGGSGRKEFISRWKPENPKGTLWKELERIIRLGGALESDGSGVFTAPYTFSRWPEKYDAFDYVFINGRNVRFRAKPGPSGEIIRKVSWEIMKKVPDNEEEPKGDWVQLKAHDGRLGYLHKDYVRSCIDYRISFNEDGKGGFKMTYLIAGD